MTNRSKPGIRLPRVFQPPGRVNWTVRMRWDGREVDRVGGVTEAQANRRAMRAHNLRVEGVPMEDILVQVFGDVGTGTRTFEELSAVYLEHLLRSKEKRPSTVRGDASRLRGLCRAGWAKRPAGSLKPTDLAKWATERARKVKPATLNRELSAASAVFSWAVIQGFVEENPARGIKRPSERGNARHVYLDADQVGELLKVASEELRPLLLAAIHTGMRRGELLSLRWRDVDFSEGTLRVRASSSKTKRERYVPMTGELAASLRALKRERGVFSLRQGGGAVFLCEDGVPITVTRLRKRWGNTLETLRKQAKKQKRESPLPEGLRFHDLRHTAASLMVNAGMDLYVVGNILGHSSSETTKRYAHLVLDRQREAIEALGRALQPKKQETAS